MQESPQASISDWKQYAQSKLPEEGYVLARNHKITCIYASLYNKYPRLLKWAGMASFASHKVGLALKPFGVYDNCDGFLDTSTCSNYSDLGVMDDVNIIRQTNNKVYDDIAWAHFAYVSKTGGIELLKQLLADEKESLILKGFLNIDKGRELLEQGGSPRIAAKYIWYGNKLLLKHEQMFTVQPMFGQLDFVFRRLLTLSTAMDFDGKNLRFDRKTYTSFYVYMWLWGKWVMVKTKSLPSIVNFQHRWLWIDKKMLKIWKRVDSRDKTLMERITTMVEMAWIEV